MMPPQAYFSQNGQFVRIPILLSRELGQETLKTFLTEITKIGDSGPGLPPVIFSMKCRTIKSP